MIDASERKSSSLLIIIQEKYMMLNWLFFRINLDAIIIISEHDFTNNVIKIEFLKYFIKYINTELHSEWKFLLMNNYENHEIIEFLKLINDNHILSYSLISYFIHCMQLFDIDVFQLYKY